MPVTPSTTPARTKKKLSLRKLRPADSSQPPRPSPGPPAAARRGGRGGGGGGERSSEAVTSDTDSPPALVISAPDQSGASTAEADFPFTFPEAFRQASQVRVTFIYKKK